MIERLDVQPDAPSELPFLPAGDVTADFSKMQFLTAGSYTAARKGPFTNLRRTMNPTQLSRLPKTERKGCQAYLVMFNCQETPNSSWTHANFLLNGYSSSGMRTFPPLDNTSKYFASASSLEFST